MFPLWQYCDSDRFAAIVLFKHTADALINHLEAEQGLISSF